jgi:HD-GYP domain-containing protein (c-di-GMP phosphodiesterase class II)
MVANRVYKEASSPFTILAWFAEGRFSELDMEYVGLFLECVVNELKGKRVLLSDGAVAEVLYVNSLNYEYPIVKVGEKVISTNPEIYTVRMYTE